ncbi:hypothetical protein [Variovorax sp. YR216]|uniref:hypothetical protein n=1 Tax=Variovorax sp. YR216 TaxID=1882828 RepID=UPI00115FA61A|nr:hypothetical protein [Variovorax sp. YR216]
MTQLSWDDLFTDASHLEFQRLLDMWPKTVSGPLVPIGASAFGDLFFLRPPGNVEKLDVLVGGVHYAASSFDEFKSLMNSRYWRDMNLLTGGVRLAQSKGHSRKPTQFFGFSAHPSSSERIDWSSAKPMDAVAWHAVCAKKLDGFSQ